MRQKLNVLISAVALLVGTAAFAQTSPTDRLNVDFRYSFVYDDNLFLGGQEQNDTYSFYTLRVDTEYTLGSLMVVGLEGIGTAKNYDEFKKQDETGYQVEPRLIIGDNVLSLGLYGFFERSIKPIDSTNQERAKFRDHSGRAVFTVKPGDLLGMELGGATHRRDYVKYPELDHTASEVFAGLFLQPSDKTRVGVRYLFGDQDYDKDVRYDGETQRGTLFVDYSATGKTNLNVELGVESHKYDFKVGAVGDDDDADSVFFADVSMDYEITGKTSMQMGVRRGVTQGSSTVSNYYVETKPYLGFVLRPTGKLTIDLRGYYADTDENNTFDSRTTHAETTISYALTDNLLIELSYGYTTREADSSVDNYHRNVSSAGLMLTF